jgi:predicted amidophosphoribosyltransferase
MPYLRPDPAGTPPQPAGIGNCASCAYLDTGTSGICYACARTRIQPLAAPAARCPICDQVLESGVCGNRICGWSLASRYFEWNFAIAMRTGVLETAINNFKYRNRHGWKNIFGRVLVGFLDDKEETFSSFDLIVASPTFLDPASTRRYDHTRDVILAAEWEADGRWPFDTSDPPAIVKTAATPPLVGHGWSERRRIAEGELRASLSIPNRTRTEGMDILVYDDVFTDGFTLREAARCLKQDGGAQRVCGVTLARQPWSGSSAPTTSL